MTKHIRTDAGDTLIEILMTVMILGVLAVGFITAMASASEGSGAHQDEAYAQSLAVAAAEDVQQATWVECAQASDYTSAARSAFSSTSTPSPPWTASRISITTVKYWTGVTFATGSTNCHDLGTSNPVPNGGLQLIQVSVTSPDNKATETVWFIKRDVNDS